MNPDAEARIRMLENSLRCFVCGLLGLLPVIGLPFAVAALVLSGQIRAGQKKYWNAARPYWLTGVLSATAGTVFWSFILMLIIYSAVSNSNGSGYYGYGGGGD
jgi:hypothetical protein